MIGLVSNDKGLCMRGFFVSLFALLILALAPVDGHSYGADGYDQYSGEKALVIIRFNQPTVMYERSLYVAISRALQTKPSAIFDVVGMAPGGQEGTAERNLGRVVGTLTEMGVPRNRLNIVRQANSPVQTSEVHIFAR